MRKQVIFLMTDTTRKDMVGCYGYPKMKTPNLDRLAEEGIRYENAYTCQPVCGPARSAIFTGTFPHTNGMVTNSIALGDNVKTIGQRLYDHGIQCGYIGKWHLDGSDYFGNGRCPEGWDPEYWYDMKTYLNELTDEEKVKSRNPKECYKDDFSEEFTYAHRCSNRAIKYLEKHQNNDFFLSVSYDEPHGPSLCPKPYNHMYDGFKFDSCPNFQDDLSKKPFMQRLWSGKNLHATEDEINRPTDGLSLFLGCNSYVDYEIGRVLDKIREVGLVQKLGGGAEGWRTIAIIYAIIGLISNTLTVFSVKELPEEELRNGEEKVEEKYSLIESIKMLVHNKYYIVILVVDILRQTYSAIINCGIYYMTYVLGKAELLGTFSGAINLALIVGLAFLPMLVAKYKGYYKLNFSGYLIAAAGRGIVIIAGYMGNVPLMLAGTAIGAIGMAPWQGNLNALVAECSEHTFLQYGKRIDGTMYSCTSMGLKVGSGLGTAIVGWLLNFGGFNGQLKVQSQSCINMLHFMYLWLPMIINILVALLLTQLNVEKANEKLRIQKEIGITK